MAPPQNLGAAQRALAIAEAELTRAEVALIEIFRANGATEADVDSDTLLLP